jgi:hypothetical protein
VIDDFPAWLTVDNFEGTVPGSFQAIFTCDVGPGNLDLAHVVQVQGLDASSGNEVGTTDTVTVTVTVRP